ncbi:MAG: hypothetical protein E6I84_13240 [Chloroflexi bacterium]|nr:MAG: hypothetical protein E6I84_13240 [Chloroflexota bacterium]
MVDRDVLAVVDLPGRALERSRVLMAKYADVPMSLADATFTLDSDFSVYRFRGRRALDLIPSRR